MDTATKAAVPTEDNHPVIREVDKCRACGGGLTFLFNLGNQYVSDFVEPGREKDGVKCPIELALCNGCTLVQQRWTAPQDFLYSRHYWYRSGTTVTMRAALADVAGEACRRVGGVRAGDVVLDVGANDGTLLSYYPTADGPTRVGVEPASNLAKTCAAHCDVFINDFWSAASYFDNLFQRKAKIVTACGMFYDLDDPNRFIGDVAKVLHPEGLFVAQLMCLRQTLRRGDVGNLAHEHLEFYSLRSLDSLFSRAGLKIVDVEENDVNGGSYRLYARHLAYREELTDRAKDFYTSEHGYDKPRVYRDWIIDRERNRAEVRRAVLEAKHDGKRVWVYGASTKGNVLLQWYGLDHHVIEAAVDKSPEKWGKVTVGTGIRIKNEEEFRASSPDYALVLPYAFTNEFVEREKDFRWRQNGGKFLVPLPELRIL